ncbi:MAG: GerMN domain-containing protein [Acidimicrobiales bacterium]|nr:GerMN domain-containing protein [Acidimicrobiales bacterium]
MTGTGPRRRTALACLLVLLGASAACGIPGDDGPRAIDREQIPANSGADSDGAGDGRTALADLYFATPGDTIDNLVIVRREVPAGSSTSPTPSTVLENLLLGPQDDDDPVGDVNLENVVTLIPPETQLASPPELDDGILTVDLNSAINGVQGEGARSAYAQLVCTADALAEVRGVRFTIDGEPVNAPTAGENSSAPLTCESYANRVLASPR